MVHLPLKQVPIVDYGPDQLEMESYRKAGTERALALGNRGPLSFDDAGKLDSTIVEAYSRCGFYVFEGVLEEEELADIERDVAHILERAPVTRSAKLDSQGRPALGIDCEARNFHWVRPLSDPVGGTNAAHGRHPAKMTELAPPMGAPEHVVQVVLGSLQFSDACLRVYGHPELLAVAEAALRLPAVRGTGSGVSLDARGKAGGQGLQPAGCRDLADGDHS